MSMKATDRRTHTSSDRAERTLYNRIAVLRAERSLSRQDLAEALSINYQTVGYIERGDFNPSLELAFRFSEFFSLPIEAIFSRAPLRPMSEAVYGGPAPSSAKEERHE